MDTTNQTIRWGIIGCGNVTEVKSGPAYQKVKNFKLAAVMRRNEALAKDYAQRHGVEKYYANAVDLINDPDIDAVYIATPPDSHKEYAVKVAQAGKICCVEKPLAPSLQDSQAILDAFKAADVPLFVAYYRRSLPRFTKVKYLIDSGKIGKVRHISWSLYKSTSELDLSKQYNWRTDKKVALGGYFDDLASHGLDLFAYLLGDYHKVCGMGNNQQDLYTAFDTVTACWQHKTGVTGTGNWNFGSYSNSDKVSIVGSKGELNFSVFDETSIKIKTATSESKIFIEHPENVQLHHVENMQKHLLHGEKHPSSGETATHTSWVMDQILL